MSIGAAIQIGLPLLPLAGFGLSTPFFGNQQKGKDNIYGGINFGPSQTSNPFNFQDLLNLGKKDTFNENFLQGKSNDTSGNTLKTDTFTPQLPEGNINYSLVGNQPTEFLSEQNQILGADGEPISGTSSTTSSTTSPNNNNNNNEKDKKSGMGFGTFLGAQLGIDLAGRLYNKIQDAFGKKDDKDEDDDRSDFEKYAGVTLKDAMDMQRKRENELMNKRALMGGISDASKYAYLGGQAYQDAAKNIGRNTQDMLRSMVYGQAALANTIAGASKTAPLTRTYFS